MSNLADSAEAAANGRATPFLPGVLPGTSADVLLDEATDEPEVEARDYWAGVWLRLRRDKLAIAGFVIFIAQNEVAINVARNKAKPNRHVQNEPEFLRLLYGAQVSLEVGVGATLLSLFLGTLLGAIAGFFRGWADTTISRMVDLTMAFPYLLFVITLAATLGTRLNSVTFGFLGEGVVTLVLVFGLLGWFYSARVMRSVALSIREKEFVEAARMVGASNWRIVRSHVFPHLVGPLIVLATLNVAAFILAEAGLSFLGLGIQLPTASWGTLLADAPQYYTSRPLLMVWPGVALLLTTLAFNLLGDGLRDAFDPRGSR